MKPMVRKLLGSPLVTALASPLSVDDYLALVEPTLSLREPRGRLRHVARPTPDAVTLTIAPNDNWGGHRPGQHVLLGVELDGARHVRCFSVASAPDAAELEITVKRNGDGRLSNHLVDHAAVGDVVHLSAAEGDFYAHRRAPAKPLLLSAGSGITPVIGILRHWIARGEAGDAAFVHYARSRADTIYADELDAIAAHDDAPALHVIETARQGRISETQLDALVPDWPEREIWLCGPAGFMETTEAIIGPRATRALHREQFAATRREAAAGEGDVHFIKTNRRASGEQGSLLEIAEGAGLNPAYGCRMGICHACKCRVAEGRVRDLRNNRVREVRDADLQLCVHAAAGDVAVEL